MKSFIYDPSAKLTRQELFLQAKAYVEEACSIWKIPVVPNFTARVPTSARRYLTGGTYYGCWIPPNKLFVNVNASTYPVSVKGRVWSYPGYKTDRTAVGITAHEFAHHIAYYLPELRQHKGREAWRRAMISEKPVTSYEPTLDESWAETVRIFILNPDLLKQARPRRYEFVSQLLTPLHNFSWRVVLSKAPEFVKTAAENFANQGERPCQKNRLL